jgi:hypothetical protein
VTDSFTPKLDWADGPPGLTAIRAAELIRIEQGIEALDVEADSHLDRLNAIEAALANITLTGVPVVTTATRGTPSKGRVVFDDDLDQYIGGTGTSWVALGEGSEVGGPGSGSAPTNFTAVVQSDDSIVLSWTAVPGASHYKLYEVRSPSGVAGADNIVGTTNTRTPGGVGNYEYWCTAFVNGVESAESNHGICSLPFGSDPGNPGGGGSGGTPAQLLALGAGGGKWNLGVGYPSGHVDIAPATLEGGWSEAPYFYTNAAGSAVHFQVPMNGGKTSANTSYPRVELREYTGSSKAAWNGSSGTHIMTYRTTVLHMEDGKPECVIGQIHDGSDDTLQIRCEGTTWRASINGTEHSTTLGTAAWGVEVAIEIRLVNGQLTLRFNGSTRITTNPGYGSGQYFKIGMYTQQNNTSAGGGNPSNGYTSCLLRDLVVSHS